MTDTLVSYHVDDEVGRPAINVKDTNAGHEYHPQALMFAFPLAPETSGAYVEQAYDRVQSDFWQAAQEIATQRGLGEIAQQGRSGGWLVFTDYDPALPSMRGNIAAEQDEERAEWLAGYRSMVEWADAWIADAPRKVAALAQQMAMDEAGEEPARRMFAFRPSIGAASWAYNGGAPKEVMA